MRVATKFKNLSREWFNEKGITQYETITSLGATENSHIIEKSWKFRKVKTLNFQKCRFFESVDHREAK